MPSHLVFESYAGQYVPNIAHYILNNEPFTSSIKLTGIAIGNACWGGNATHVECNGTMQCPPHRSTAPPLSAVAAGTVCTHPPLVPTSVVPSMSVDFGLYGHTFL